MHTCIFKAVWIVLKILETCKHLLNSFKSIKKEICYYHDWFDAGQIHEALSICVMKRSLSLVVFGLSLTDSTLWPHPSEWPAHLPLAPARAERLYALPSSPSQPMRRRYPWDTQLPTPVQLWRLHPLPPRDQIKNPLQGVNTIFLWFLLAIKE